MLLISFRFNAQNADSPLYRDVDEKVVHYSKSYNYNYDSLIVFVKTNFNSDREKIRALYTWIALNISYDKQLLDNYKLNSGLSLKRLSSLITQSPDTVLKYKKAVCEGYSLLMNKCCSSFGINSVMVIGPTKLESGEITKNTLHAWNSIKVEEEWKLLDVTWANGYVNQMNQYKTKFSDHYFFPKPEEFIKDHWPLDPMWQLLIYPLSKDAFQNGEINKVTTAFYFKDSIASFLRLPEKEEEYLSFLHYHTFDKQNLEYSRECDRIIHDQMVTYLNLAAVYYDDYQQYIKKQTGKLITEKLIKECLRLLKEPKLYLEKSLKYASHKSFFHIEIKNDFEKLITSAKESLAEVNASMLKYRKLAKTLKENKK